VAALVLLISAPALAQTPTDPSALMAQGRRDLARAGALAQQGQFGPANEAMRAGMTEMDRAVALAPDRLDLRITRGLAYGAFPAFLNTHDQARADLERAVHHPDFGALPQAQRDRVSHLLASLADANARPDRFPNISPDVSPIIAAASVTFSNTRPATTPDWLTYLLKSLDGFPGLLATHTVASVDHPGMFIIFTWWQNKAALDDFFYSDVHQRWMRRRGEAMTGDRDVLPADVPLQVGIEILSALPGGTQMNGGLIPAPLFTGKGAAPAATK
jgi:heme-degrading monooxygenase HmoA